jgi:hypothetical protein
MARCSSYRTEFAITSHQPPHHSKPDRTHTHTHTPEVDAFDSDGEETAGNGKRKAGRLEEQEGHGVEGEGREGGEGGRMVDVSLEEESEEERRQMMLMMTARQEEEDESAEGGDAMAGQDEDGDGDLEDSFQLSEGEMTATLLDAVRAIRRAREDGRQGGAMSASADDESEEASQGASFTRIPSPFPVGTCAAASLLLA